MNGVGYIGHVMGAATALTYMRQRYYDPAIVASSTGSVGVGRIVQHQDPLRLLARCRGTDMRPSCWKGMLAFRYGEAPCTWPAPCTVVVLGDGRVRTGNDLLEAARQKSIAYEHQVEDDGTQIVRFFGPNTAVVTSRGRAGRMRRKPLRC